jgi:FkbM family methyltransferase
MTLASLKAWVATKLGLRRVFAATNYLLIRQLNTELPAAGADGNRRLQEAFLGLVGALRPGLFLDIGANDGAAAVAARRAAPGCVVHAFEANPRTHAKHKRRLEEQGIRSWNLAIDRQDGRAKVYAPRSLSRAYVAGEVVPASVTEGEDTGKASLLRRNEEATYEEFEVEAATLDSFVDAHVPDWRGRTAFLWVDVEGAAERVLAGAGRLLTRTRAIFLETESFDLWLEQSDRGAVIARLMRAGFLPVARDREYGDEQFNILFVHHGCIDAVLPQLFDARSPLRLGAEPDVAAVSEPARPLAAAVRPARPYVSAAAALQSTIPVLIPSFNAVSYVRNMVDQLRRRGLRRLIIVDNASSYPPMLDYLAAPGPDVTVVLQTENKGPRDLFLDPATYAALPEVFCVTDPDLALNPAMPEDFVAHLVAATESFSVGKAGLAIDIADRAAMRQEDFRIGDRNWKIWEWESQFWQDQAGTLPGGDPVFRAPVDTTFAAYNKRFFNKGDPLRAVRVAGRYTCRHLPWYKDVGLPAEEELFYRRHARDSYYLRDPDSGLSPRY